MQKLMGKLGCDSEFYKNITNIFISALVLFTALAWRDCAIVWVERNPSVKDKGPWVYASVITILAILVISFLMFPLKNFVCG